MKKIRIRMLLKLLMKLRHHHRDAKVSVGDGPGCTHCAEPTAGELSIIVKNATAEAKDRVVNALIRSR